MLETYKNRFEIFYTSIFHKIVLSFNKKTGIIFIISLLLGVYVALNAPPFSVPDESAHYLRAYEVSKLNFLNFSSKIGVDIPAAEYYEVVLNNKGNPRVAFYSEPVAPPVTKVNTKNTAAIYSPIPYIPAAIGFAIAEKLGFNTTAKLKTGRIITSLTFSIILFFAILTSPQLKWLYLFISIIPTFCIQKSCLGTDSMLFGFCMLYLSLCFNSDAKLSYSKFGFIILISTFIVLCKSVYAIFSVFSLIMLLNNYKTRSTNFKFLLSYSFLPILFSFSVGFVFQKLVDKSLIYMGNGADPISQIHHIVKFPLLFFSAIKNTLYSNFYVFIEQIIIQCPVFIREPDKYFLESFYIAVYLINSLSTCLVSGKINRIFLLFTNILLLLATFLGLYLIYNPPGHSIILGLQGRYFLMPLLIFSLTIGSTKCILISENAKFIIFGLIPSIVTAFIFLKTL
jgi:uncharacterized membrane protein